MSIHSALTNISAAAGKMRRGHDSRYFDGRRQRGLKTAMDATPSQIREIMVRLQRDYLAQMKPHIAVFRRMKALMVK